MKVGAVLAKKYYVVKEGRTPGIYTDWASCKAQVEGYSNAVYKSFKSLAEAGAWLEGAEQLQTPRDEIPPEHVLRAYIDGSFERSSGRYAYGLVAQYEGQTIEENGWDDQAEWAAHHNVAGELLGALRVFRLAEELKAQEVEIFYDYQGIAAWATGDWKANLPLTQAYAKRAAEAQAGRKIRFFKVKAHSGNPLNERVDALAKAALESKSSQINADLI